MREEKLTLDGTLAVPGPARAAVYERMMDCDGDTIIISAHRQHETVARQPHAHISQGAMDDLIEQVRLWLGTRMIRKERSTGLCAHTVELEVRVKTEGPLESPSEPRLTVRFTDVLNGVHQAEASR
jgi:hypothetical protein